MKAPADMYYVAVICPPPVSEKVLQFKHCMKERFGCMAALKSPAHITLIPPFRMPGADEDLLRQSLATFNSEAGELEIQLNGFSHFGKKVLFIQVNENPALANLKKQVEAHFMQSVSSIKKEERSFHPHITIANRDMKPHHFEKAWEYFSGIAFKESFTMNRVSLLKLAEGKWEVIGEKLW